VDQLHTATTFPFFEVLLAAVAQLDGVMQDWTPGRVGDWWKSRTQSYALVAGLLDAADISPTTRRLAVQFLPAGHAALGAQRLGAMIESPDTDLELQLTVVRALGTDPESGDLRQWIASDPSRPDNVRAEAIMGLDPDLPAHRAQLLGLADFAVPVVRKEALRTLRGAALAPDEARSLSGIARHGTELAQLVTLVLEPELRVARPPLSDTDAWLKRLEGPADPATGARVFFHPRGAGCGKCHRIDGRGDPQIGPTILRTRGVQSFTRRQLVESLLQPNKEIALGYTPLQVVTRDGRIHIGIPRRDGDRRLQLVDSAGKEITIDRGEVDEISAHPRSIMPDGLIERLTDGELRDLIAYLLQP
jgi:putative heme-binding domain-containing protein